jgi:uncharacterized protein (DUF4415 family)
MAIKIIGEKKGLAARKRVGEAHRERLKKEVEKIAPVKAPGKGIERKDSITIRLDKKVVEFFKVGGIGWQSRINSALRKIAGLE